MGQRKNKGIRGKEKFKMKFRVRLAFAGSKFCPNEPMLKEGGAINH